MLLQVAGKPLWWIVLFIIPFVNFVAAILVSLDVAKNFGKGAGFGIGLGFLPFIFYPLLGFSDASIGAPRRSGNFAKLGRTHAAALVKPWLIGVSHAPRVIGTVNFCGVSRFLAAAM